MSKAKDESLENLPSRSSIYSVVVMCKDPISHAIICHLLTACVVLCCLIRFWSKISLTLCVDWRCWISILLLGAAWLKVVRLLCNGYFLKKNVLFQKDMKGKTVVITGASSGLGKQCACEIVKCGGNVILGCRDESRGLRARADVCRHMNGNSRSQTVELLPLDLEVEESIRKFAQRIISRNIRVDVLVNNAGIMMPQRLMISKSTGVESQMATNHLGHFLLTLLLLDNIKKCSGRVINVSSISHCNVPDVYRGFSLKDVDEVNSQTYGSSIFYGMSKLANILFTLELQRRLFQTSRATTYSLNPGCVKSDILKHSRWFSRAFYNPITPLVEALLLKSTECGAYTYMYLCAADKAELVPGAYYCDCCIGMTLKAATNAEKAKELWLWSEKKWKLPATQH